MTAVILPAGAPTGKHIKWKSINWKKVSMFVKRLQMRIAKAVKEKRYGKVKALQRLLTTIVVCQIVSSMQAVYILRGILK